MYLDKKTKIVCTIGPHSSPVDKLTALLKSGMNMIRMNFSHGDFAEHQEKVDNLKIAEKKTGLKAAVMQDLCGPKIRTGDFADGKITLNKGDKFTFTTDKIVGDQHRVSINYPALTKEISVGMNVLLNDGKQRFEVLEIVKNDIICKVIVGGEIKSRRTMNLPGAKLSISSLTAKDKADLAFGIKNKVDYVAFSFVRKGADVLELRALLDKAGLKDTKIIAKVEDVEGMENIDEIIELVDGVMVARGDMAVEVGPEFVPFNQKYIISECRRRGKFSIVATQMMSSMMTAPVPTRAEVSDVATAIVDGADAIMTSEETTLGDFVVETIDWMTKIAKQVENDARLPMYRSESFYDASSYAADNVDHNYYLCSNAAHTAEAINAKAVAVLTHDGTSARMVSRMRPSMPIFAYTTKQTTVNQLTFIYGVSPIMTKKFISADAYKKFATEHLKKTLKLQKGDQIVIVFGKPIGKLDMLANTMSIVTI